MNADIITFLIALAALYIFNLWADEILEYFLNQIKIAIKIKKMSQGIIQAGGAEEFDEDLPQEGTGLNKKGPRFGENALLNRIAEVNVEFIEEMQSLLAKAGLRNESDLEEFFKSKMNSVVALFFIIFLTLTINNEEWQIDVFLAILVSLIASILFGHKLTNLNMEMLANKRKTAIDKGVPDLIDLLVICTESGLDLNSAIRRIAREMRTSNPIMADELSLTSIELEMIPDHRVVFTNLENRTDCLEIKTLSKTFSQAIEYGSSLSSSLKELATESRQRRMLNAEAAAASAPTLLTLPMMFFTMPCLFIVMLGPVIVGVMRSFKST